TRSWTDYTTVSIGQFKLLPAGKTTVTLKATSKSHRTVMGFRSVELIPVQPAAFKPLPSPNMAKGDVYTDKHEGQCGYAQFTHGNNYHFDIPNTPSRAVVLVDADTPTHSSWGEVRLRYGESMVVIGKW